MSVVDLCIVEDKEQSLFVAEVGEYIFEDGKERFLVADVSTCTLFPGKGGHGLQFFHSIFQPDVQTRPALK